MFTTQNFQEIWRYSQDREREREKNRILIYRLVKHKNFTKKMMLNIYFGF